MVLKNMKETINMPKRYPSKWLFVFLLVAMNFGWVASRKAIVVAGNFSIDGVQYNIAEFDPSTDSWRENYNSQVYLYSEENSGVVWDMAINETEYYTDVFAAGLFDTDAKMSQVQLCSVAFYESGDVDKVGEGLCSRGGDYGPISVRSIVVGSHGDLFVGGCFVTRVWDRNRHKFVLVSHVARFDASSSSWLPLEGGTELVHDNADNAKVNSLYWDAAFQELYIGGMFHAADNASVTPNLAVWSADGGMQGFYGGAKLSIDGNVRDDFEITNIFQETSTMTMIIIGTFTRLDTTACYGIALWNRLLNDWRCLMETQDMLLSVDAAAFNGHKIFLAGPLVPDVFATKPTETEYGIIYMSIDAIVDEFAGKIKELFPSNDTGNSTSSSTNPPVGSANGTHFLDNHKRRLVSRLIKRLDHRSFKNLRGQDHQRRRHLSSSTPQSQVASTPHRRSPLLSPLGLFSPWTALWNWLPQLPFLARRILRIQAGSDEWLDSLFISLDNDTQPALLAWNFPPRKNGNGNTSFIGGHHHAPYGSIHSIQLVTIPQPHPPTPSPVINPVPVNRDYTYVVVISCIGVGLVLGAGMICTCMGVGNLSWKLHTATAEEDEGDVEESDEKAAANEPTLGPLSLKTLTDSGQTGGTSLDFKECFERAMKTRHLPTYETLVIINPKEILLSRIIGEGSFGRVWSGQWRNNAVAVKEFVFAQAAIAGGSLQRNSIIEEIVGEAGVMACLRHPKILQLYGCSLTMQAIWIVSELCLLGSLKMLLMNPKVELPLLKRLSMLLDIADGMQYLHNRTPPIIHRDLKSHNIFIQETFPGHYVAKIGDWGSARAVALTGAKSMTQGVGTACWLSPEVINNAHFSKSSDVYAFGIILWEVYTRQEIYEGLSAAQIIAKVAHEGLRPQVPRDCPWASIMTKCWRQDPTDRPSFETILSSLGKNFLKLTSKMTQTAAAAAAAAAGKQDAPSSEGLSSSPSTSGRTGVSSTSGAATVERGNVVPTSVGPYSTRSVVEGIALVSMVGSSETGTASASVAGGSDTTSSRSQHSSGRNYSRGGGGGGGGGGGEGGEVQQSTTPPGSLRSAYRTFSGERLAGGMGMEEPSTTHDETTSLLRPPIMPTVSSRSGSGKSLKYLSQQQQVASPSKRSSSSRSGKFFDSFHPSLENIVTETKTPFSSGRLSQVEESPAHLAPEIAQLEAQGLLTSQASQGYFASGSHSGSGVGLALEDDAFDDDAPDPIDFLFDSHRRSQRKKK